MANRETYLQDFLHIANENPSSQVVTQEFVKHMDNTNIKNKKEMIKYVTAILEGDLVDAGGISNDPEAKANFMRQTENLKKGMGMVIAGDDLETKGVKQDDIANTAIICTDAMAFQKDGKFKVNGREVQMDETAKNTELSRRFVEILAKGKDSIVRCYNRAKEGAKAIGRFLGLKVKELSDRWLNIIHRSERGCREAQDQLIEKCGLEPVQTATYGPSR